MKIKYISIGKSDDSYLADGIAEYEKRILRYVPYESVQIHSTKSSIKMNQKDILAKEAEKISHRIVASDFVIVLDERGKELKSVEFAAYLNKKFQSGNKTLVFISGGPFGIHESLKTRADMTLSLSKMTFPHLLIRLIFLEQLYRAMTINAKEAYHHD
jgi:23S rRNA (pseudouridine1915-N3)-methyltransferase